VHHPHPLASSAQRDPRRFVAAILFLAWVTTLPAAAQVAAKAEAPYVPTPVAIVDRMLTLTAIGPGDYVIDLGSGDGRLVTTAVAKYNARGGLGFEIDPRLVKEANEKARNAGVGDRVKFVERDLFTADVSEATVVTLYLVPGIMGRVEDKLLKELKPGTRVVSHDYPLPSWKPVDVVEFETEDKVPITGTRRTMLLLYRVPDKTR